VTCLEPAAPLAKQGKKIYVDGPIARLFVRFIEGSRIPGKNSYDAVVIGAGHNGLTAAAYLAGAGLSTLVLERREIVGGCCVTEEIAPGCRASTTSYIASMLRPEVIRDLDLPSFGLRMVPCDPFLQVPFPDGQMIRWWADRERVAEEIKEFSARDARTGNCGLPSVQSRYSSHSKRVL
jgi:phytoene dehydrogenase-like protein